MIKDLEHVAPKGEGYFCRVSQYRSKLNGDLFAVKFLKKEHYNNDDYKYRLNREIELLRQLEECDGAVNLLGSGEIPNKETIYYVMPFADHNLYDYIKSNNGKITIEERYDISLKLINALKCAHSKNILHRDLSPLNVLLFKTENSYEVKICDFGLGKNIKSLSHYSSSAVKGYGQILYVSPEQRDKLKDADKRSDIFSLGKLLYFIFTAKDPDNVVDTEISTLVNKATGNNPDDRHQNLEELTDHFNSILLLQDDVDIPLEMMSLSDFDELESDNFLLFHRVVKNINIVNHAFNDYLSYVLDIFDSEAKINEYYSIVGSSIKDFVKITVNHIDSCLGQYGWDFKQTNRFGTLLLQIATIVKEDDIKLEALKMMYQLAFQQDQWSVQSDVKAFLKDYEMPLQTATQFAEYIQYSKICIESHHAKELKVPKIVKNAIRRVLMENC